MKDFLTVTFSSFVLSVTLWIIWFFFLNFDANSLSDLFPSLFYLPHAARVLCIVYFGYKAIPGLYLAELWGPLYVIPGAYGIEPLLTPLIIVLSVPLALETLALLGFKLGRNIESPLNKRNYKHLALITIISAVFNSFLVNLYVEGSSITTSQNLNDVLTFFMGDIIGTTLVFIVLAIILKPLFVRNNKINHSR